MKIKKTETIQEFLERGGKIVVVPPNEPEETKNVVKPTAGGLPQLLSLDDGAHFFGETKKKKKKTISAEEFKDKASNLNLPKEIIASLIKSVGANNE